ncbi:hypothetical protein [uncultured Roseobacter sp.]|uniref:hypothetical protein n=1 Tax=uncultured Roseobacter sp. TaxID=114847 RepID=UPI002628C98C|nr:hypothetical protein [uncultured Roseobacter sp.]
MNDENVDPGQAAIFNDQPALVRTVRAFWRTNPFFILAITFLLGVLPLVFAVLASPVGSVVYYMPTETFDGDLCVLADVPNGRCVEKQVGYSFAINWWPVLVVLMPFSLFFAFSSVQQMQRVFRNMLAHGMFCASDWSPPSNESKVVPDLKKMVRYMWVTFSISGLVIFLLIAWTMFNDWYCVVHAPLTQGELLTNVTADKRPALCQNMAGQELDWSISAIFASNAGIALPAHSVVPSTTVNWWFSAYVYFLMSVQLSLLMIYFCFVFSLAVTVFRLRQGSTNLRIIPNLKSADPLDRMGFENFEPVMQPCILVTILSFIMAFLMRLQNEYLRSKEPGNVFQFMFSGIDDLVSADGGLKNVGLLFDTGLLGDPNSQIGGPAVIVVFALVSVVLAFLLRRTAIEARNQVQAAVNHPEKSPKILALYGMDRDEVLEKLTKVSVWPLGWPRLRQMLTLAGFGIACFYFYKLAFVWIAIVLIRLLQGGLTGKSEA